MKSSTFKHTVCAMEIRILCTEKIFFNYNFDPSLKSTLGIKVYLSKPGSYNNVIIYENIFFVQLDISQYISVYCVEKNWVINKIANL